MIVILFIKLNHNYDCKHYHHQLAMASAHIKTYLEREKNMDAAKSVLGGAGLIDQCRTDVEVGGIDKWVK